MEDVSFDGERWSNAEADRIQIVEPDPGWPEKFAAEADHVHMRTASEVRDMLLFRDYLIAHPEAAARYERLKRRLATRCATDCEAYCRGKDTFVGAILMEARRGSTGDDPPDEPGMSGE